jgi:hypothetical protein
LLTTPGHSRDAARVAATAAGVTDTLWNLETFYDVVNQHEKDMKRKAANRRLIERLNRGE